MNYYSLLLIIIVFLLLFSFISLTECPVFTCTNLDKAICSQKSDIYDYLLQECPRNTYCSFDYTKDESKCLVSEYEYNKPAYPGGKCLTSLDCLSNNCLKHVCQGSNDNCKDNTQCDFGKYCDDSLHKCQPTKSQGETCSHDYECHWSLGCYYNQCTKFFSIPNGVLNEKSKESLCASGLVYDKQCNSINDSTDKICMSESVPCHYIDASGHYLTIENTCVCTISGTPGLICKGGDIDNPYWASVMRILKDLMNKEERKCNAIETKPGFCREELRNDWSARNILIELTKSQLLFEQGDRLTKTTPCGLKTIFSFDDTPPLPKDKVFKCPVYKCNNDNKGYGQDKDNAISCANSTNPFNEQGSNIEVSLKTVCNDNSKCNFNQDRIFLNWTSNSTCKEIPTSQSWSYKYPGEDCISHDQCIKGSYHDVGFCINGVCSGREEDKECKTHGDCLKGSFCNGKYCQEQKGETHFCLDSFECLNYLGCLNNTCVRYYSLPNGTYLNSSNPDASLCQMGQMNKRTNQCSISQYYNIPEYQKDSEGFVECSIGDKCQYTTGFLVNGKPIVESKECQCGFSVSGKSYCPLPQTRNTDDWIGLFKLMNKRYDNRCHTLRRHVCLNEVTFKDQDNFNWYKRRTFNAHLFHDANDCIIKVLSSTHHSLSYLVVISLYMLILI